MSMIKELINKNSRELFEESKEKAKKNQPILNAFVTIMDKYEKEESNSLINGIPYALKDNYSTKGILTTGSSNLLKDYIPVYDATVYKKLKEAGAVLLGKTVLDEFGLGGTGTTGHTGVVRNPYNTNHQAGGSSAGSAASVAAGIVPFSIGSDTGDSVRKPASFVGIVGFKPTYGRISRFGLMPFASSLDHVGVFTTCVEDAAIVTDVLKGQDEKDLTSLENDNTVYSQNINKEINGTKLFYIKEVIESDKDSEAIKLFEKTVDLLKQKGIEVYPESIDKNLLNALYPTYIVISSAEATSNLSNLTGVVFGTRNSGNTFNEVLLNTRTYGFSELIKRRLILGSYVLQKENQEKLFLNACRIRKLVVEKINQLYEKYDGLIMPASGGVASKLEGEDLDKLSDRYLLLESHLAIGNFGGFPSITLPMGFINKMPIGINLTCKAKDDLKTLNIAYHIESVTGLKGITCGGETNV